MAEIFVPTPIKDGSQVQPEFEPIVSGILRAERVYPTRGGYKHQSEVLPSAIKRLDVPPERSLESQGFRISSIPKSTGIVFSNGYIKFRGAEGSYQTTRGGKGFPAFPSVVITQTDISGKPVYVCRFENLAVADPRKGMIEFMAVIDNDGGNKLISSLEVGLDLPVFLEEAYLAHFGIDRPTQQLWENPPKKYMFVLILKEEMGNVVPALTRRIPDGSEKPINIFIWRRGEENNHRLEYCK
jgi:hypothetical protein